MIVDWPAEGDAEMECDLCVVGAGAAGITIAREFAGSDVQVCLVESGGLDYEDDIQDLYEGDAVGRPYSLSRSRLRYFGGTTNHWAGFCKSLSAITFQERPWVPHSGWPFGQEDLQSFYLEAGSLCELGDAIDDERLWTELDAEADRFDADEVRLAFWRHSPPTRFGDVYGESLEQAPDVRVLLHASVTNIQTNEASSAVEQVDVCSLHGKTGRIKARLYVIACGGIESARLLLLSNRVEPDGLGNRNDLVGRFFMEHVHVRCDALIAPDRMQSIHPYLPYHHKDSLFSPSFESAETLQRREQVLGSQARLITSSGAGPALKAATRLWRDVENGRMPDEFADQISTIIRDLDDIGYYAYRRFVVGRQPYTPISSAFLLFLVEQAPNAESRVMLSDERDALGLRRARLDWRLTEFEKRSVLTFVRSLGGELARLDIGRLRLPEWLTDGGSSWPPDLQPGFHHMGTTRMSANPKQGVVDPHCRVHHIDNLYIAGSSVFPTSGHGTPTLTVIALTLRLAKHLKARLG